MARKAQSEVLAQRQHSAKGIVRFQLKAAARVRCPVRGLHSPAALREWALLLAFGLSVFCRFASHVARTLIGWGALT